MKPHTRLAEKQNKIQTRSMDENKRGSTGEQRTKTTTPKSSLAMAKKRARDRMSEEATAGGRSSLVKDPYQVALDSKTVTRSTTGLVFDRRMAEHRCLWDGNYPECPERFTEVMKRCEELKLLDRCTYIEPRSGTLDEVLLKHTEEQYETLKATSGSTNEEKLEELSANYDAIFIHPSTFELSLLSVGCTVDLVDNIISGRVQNGMAIIRPPGHHAMKSEYNGYCFFNNVAIAAQHALEKQNLKRILIVDWDVHHGQGTQQLFYDDPRVLYMSIHRFEHGRFWPNLRESNFNYIGERSGKGFNVNVPLNETGMTDADYLAIFQQLILPIGLEFDPELVIVSAGYDAALGCPEFDPELLIVSCGFDSALGDEKGEMEITPACYAHLLNPLLSLAGGKVAVILEGGYCLKSLSEGAAITLKTLLGDPCPRILLPLDAPKESLRETILNCTAVLKPYWRNLNLHAEYSDSELNNKNPQTDLHQVVVQFEEQPPPPKTFPTRDCYPKPPVEFIQRTSDRLDQLRLCTDLSYPPNRVCFVYDEFMQGHFNLFETHPERPERISRMAEVFEEFGLIDRMKRLKARPATREELEMGHTAKHVKAMAAVQGKSKAEFRTIGDRYNSVYFNEQTFECARMASGSVLQVVDEVLGGQSRSGVCIVRPPGHHAEEDMPHGFCVFNNVAVAASYAQSVHQVKRILIVDWDIHHGNGTQHKFETDPGVLYISLHRYDHAQFFPKSEDADFKAVGSGRGEGFNVNVPWNRRAMGNAEYAMAFQKVVLPIAQEYQPELVLVSAGFDAAIGDPLGGYKVTPEAYGHFTHWLSGLAQGRVIVCLEGGYNVNSISYSMAMCAKALLGDPLARLEGTIAMKQSSAVETIQNVLGVQRKYWKALRGSEKKLPEVVVVEEEKKQKIEQTTNERDLVDKFMDMKIKGEKAEVGGGVNEEPQAGSSSSSQCPSKANAFDEFMDQQRQLLKEEKMFAVYPKRECPHLQALDNDRIIEAIDTSQRCEVCSADKEIWYCLHCLRSQCGRYVAGHMEAHFQENGHPLALSFADLSVWCYLCEDYIDHPQLYKYKNLAHKDKFDEEMPWTYDEAHLLTMG